MANMGKRRYEEVCRLSNGHSRGITAVAFSAHGTYLATSGLDGKVCIWRVEDGTLLVAYCGQSPILSIAWMPFREDALLCGAKDGNIALLTMMPDSVYVNGFYAHRYPVERLAIEGDCVASGAHRELKVWRWRSSARRFLRERTLPEPPKSSHNEYKEIIVTSLHWTTSQHLSPLLLVSYLHHGIHIFQADGSWNRVRTIPLQCMIAGTSISNLGNIAVSNLVNGFDIYRMNTEVPVGLFDHTVGEPYPTPVLFIHGGNALVGGSSVGQIDIWDLDAGKMCTLSVPKHAKVLALDSHYKPGATAADYRFYIAAGIMNENAASSCIIWRAAAAGTQDAVPSEEGEYVDAETEAERSESWLSYCTRITLVTLLVLAVALVLAVDAQ